MEMSIKVSLRPPQLVGSSTFRRPLTDYSCPSPFPHYCRNRTPLIPDGDPKQRLERLGLVMVSEAILDGNIHTATYSMSNNTGFPKRDTTLEKRRDLQGASCLTVCGNATNEKGEEKERPNPSDCEILYKNLYSMLGQFTLEPSTSPSLPQDYYTKLTDARDSGDSVLQTSNL